MLAFKYLDQEDTLGFLKTAFALKLLLSEKN